MLFAGIKSKCRNACLAFASQFSWMKKSVQMTAKTIVHFDKIYRKDYEHSRLHTLYIKSCIEGTVP